MWSLTVTCVDLLSIFVYNNAYQLASFRWPRDGGGGGLIMVYSTSYFAETRGDNKEIKVIFFDFLCCYNYIFVDQEGGCVGMAEEIVIFAKFL